MTTTPQNNTLTGQALSADTLILTLKGWKTLKEVDKNDSVYTPNGTSTPVIGITGPWKTRPCYEILISNGSIIVADANHEWVILKTLDDNSSIRMTTKELATHLEMPESNAFIHNPNPLQLPKVKVQVLPNMSDNAIAYEHSKQANNYHEVATANTYLAEAIVYLSEEEREAVIEKFINPMNRLFIPENQCYKGEISKSLAKQLSSICHTLGIKTTEEETGHPKTVKLTIYPRTDESSDLTKTLHHANNYIEILSVIKTSNTETLCIQIADENHMYLAGDALTPTHTSQKTVKG